MQFSPRRVFVLIAVGWFTIVVALAVIEVAVPTSDPPAPWEAPLFAAARFFSGLPVGVRLVDLGDRLTGYDDSLPVALGLTGSIAAWAANSLFWAAILTGVILVLRRLGREVKSQRVLGR